MRADNALSHLQDGEHCVARTRNGERDVRWSRQDWCFYYADTVLPTVCRFEDIEEWRPASIRLY